MCATLCWLSSNHSLMPEALHSASPSVLSLSLSLCACVCLSLSPALYLSFSSSLSLCNGISIGRIATGIQYAHHLIESLIGCLMSACCQFTLRETQGQSHFKQHAATSWTPLEKSLSVAGSFFLFPLSSRENVCGNVSALSFETRRQNDLLIRVAFIPPVLLY